MGTRGYRVSRYKSWYFVWYNHNDSYPEGLGLEILNEVSREDFEQWLLDMRESCEKLLAEAERDGKGEIVSNNHGFHISKTQPQNALFIEWIYELDLDHLVFHVDSQPLFRLDHLPPRNEFCDWIGFDSYGIRACAAITPQEYRYDWRMPPPPMEDLQLSTYRKFLAHSGESSQIHDLLSLSESLNEGEAVRVHLLQVMVGACMENWNIAKAMRELETTPNRTAIPRAVVKMAIHILSAILDPQIFSPPRKIVRRKDWGSLVDSQWGNGFSWLRRDICFHLTTHLDDQRNFQAAIAGLVDEILSHSDGTDTDLVFGVAFSFFHVVVVRLDKKNGSSSFRHTPALQFLPSRYVDSPCTPGITALGRLAHLEDHEVFRWLAHDLSNTVDEETDEDLANNTLVATFVAPRRIPVEVWDAIASYMFEITDLLALSRVCSGSRAASARAVRRPLFGRHRLVKPIPGAMDLTGDSFHAHDENGVLSVSVVVVRQDFPGDSGEVFVSIGDASVAFMVKSPEEMESE